MKMLKCKGGAMLMLDEGTGCYWVVTEICHKAAWLFGGGFKEKAERVFNWYVGGEKKEGED